MNERQIASGPGLWQQLQDSKVNRTTYKELTLEKFYEYMQDIFQERRLKPKSKWQTRRKMRSKKKAIKPLMAAGWLSADTAAVSELRKKTDEYLMWGNPNNP